MARRYQGADIAAMILAALVVLGTFFPWGEEAGGPFDMRQAYAALFLGALAVVVFLFVPWPKGRKVAGLFIALVLLLFCWMAIDEITSTPAAPQPFGLTEVLGTRTMQAGLWTTLLSSVGLLVASLLVQTRPTNWEAIPVVAATQWTETPESAAPPLGTPAVPPPSWVPVAVAKPVRKLRCPQCGAIATVYGSERPLCPGCGYQSR